MDELAVGHRFFDLSLAARRDRSNHRTASKALDSEESEMNSTVRWREVVLRIGV